MTQYRMGTIGRILGSLVSLPDDRHIDCLKNLARHHEMNAQALIHNKSYSRRGPWTQIEGRAPEETKDDSAQDLTRITVALYCIHPSWLRIASVRPWIPLTKLSPSAALTKSEP